jgi:hypothetical protein
MFIRSIEEREGVLYVNVFLRNGRLVASMSCAANSVGRRAVREFVGTLSDDARPLRVRARQSRRAIP